ncbi:MAG: hypothetical protein AAGC44_15395 [Planctomycetota bacterium]
MQNHTILLVGHCGFDSGSLKSLAQSAVPGSTVARINDDASLQQRLAEADLLLVNRVLDGRFACGSGVELIRGLAERPAAPPMMLVSNYEEAQAQAVEAGARAGFGKSAVGRPETARTIAEAVKQHSST